MWVLFVKLLSPADWWLDRKLQLKTVPATALVPQQSATESAPLSSGSMVTARDAG
jgi:hypothetical protein